MVIKDKIGNINSIDTGSRIVDMLTIEWYEASKRIMHKHTQSGVAITLKFLQQNPDLKEGDILFKSDEKIITVEIKPCEAIVINPSTVMEAANICYEIGNKHLPLFYENDELLSPYDEPLYKLLKTSGYEMKIEERKLTNAIKTSVSPHAHQGNNSSLFNKILSLTTSS